MIRGDGPGGFGEVIIKAFLSLSSGAILIASLISIAITCYSQKPQHFWAGVSTLTRVALIIFAAVAVQSACSDNGGYCRNWGLHF